MKKTKAEKSHATVPLNSAIQSQHFSVFTKSAEWERIYKYEYKMKVHYTENRKAKNFQMEVINFAAKIFYFYVNNLYNKMYILKVKYLLDVKNLSILSIMTHVLQTSI